jgi:environmental stress-induced protein Ves
VQIIRKSSFAAVPWRNGGGTTLEAIRVPPTGEAFRWRVSVAHIEQSGPFSDFAAYHRTMILLRGGGVALHFSNGGDVLLLREVGDIARFDGAIATRCELFSGPCTDLNLIVAKTLGEARARVERLDRPLSTTLHEAGSTVVFAIDAALELSLGGALERLEPWDLAVISGARGATLRLAPQPPATHAQVFLAGVPDSAG